MDGSSGPPAVPNQAMPPPLLPGPESDSGTSSPARGPVPPAVPVQATSPQSPLESSPASSDTSQGAASGSPALPNQTTSPPSPAESGPSPGGTDQGAGSAPPAAPSEPVSPSAPLVPGPADAAGSPSENPPPPPHESQQSGGEGQRDWPPPPSQEGPRTAAPPTTDNSPLPDQAGNRPPPEVPVQETPQPPRDSADSGAASGGTSPAAPQPNEATVPSLPGSQEESAGPPVPESPAREQRVPPVMVAGDADPLTRAGGFALTGNMDSMGILGSSQEAPPPRGTLLRSEGGRRKLMSVGPAVVGTGAPAAAPGPLPHGPLVRRPFL